MGTDEKGKNYGSVRFTQDHHRLIIIDPPLHSLGFIFKTIGLIHPSFRN